MPKITVIPQTRNIFSAAPISSVSKRKVAGYARVSTDSDEQVTSYEAQVEYYTNYIKSNPRWEFVGVYTDEGISGLNTKHRDGFNQMIADALDGKIELIVTKSVSRFARNTVDSLTTIRKLKEKGVEVYFEKESIWTFDSKGELLLTIMSSLAQEESRSISENVTWSVRKRFADGRVSVPYSVFLGYDKGPDGNLVINPEEAKIVVLIYQMFMGGKSPVLIAKYLTEQGIPTPGGKTEWQSTTVRSILTNEKYKGDALLQKTFTIDYLSKKMKTNTGEIPQYYVEGNHEAIISPEEFDLVQAELERRKKYGRTISTTSIFSSRIICSDCGCFYGPKVWHSNDKYRRLVWRCNGKFRKGQKRCTTPVTDEEQIKRMFMNAYFQLESCREKVLADVKKLLASITDCSSIEEQLSTREAELEEIGTLVRVAIQDNASQANMQEAFDAKFERLRERYDAAEAAIKDLQKQKAEQINRQSRIALFLREFEHEEPVEMWDERLWVTFLDSATIFPDGSMEFMFYNGQKIRVQPDSPKEKGETQCRK